MYPMSYNICMVVQTLVIDFGGKRYHQERILSAVMVPAHFHDVTDDKTKLNVVKNNAGPHLDHS